MNTLLQDIRYGMRMLAKSPGFTAIAVAALTLGIGSTTAIFTVVNTVLLQPLPYSEPDRIMRLLEHLPSGPFGTTTLDFLDWQKQTSVFEFVAGQTGWSATLT